MDCELSPPCARDSTSECMCFLNEDTNQQMCGYVGRDGTTIHACTPTCCNGGLGCPGQCKGVPPKRPDGTYNPRGNPPKFNAVFNTNERRMVFDAIIKFLIMLCVVSTLSLFIRA